LLVAIAAVVISMISLLSKRSESSSRLIERIRALEERKVEPEILQRIVAIETKVGPFGECWRNIWQIY